MKGSDFVFDSVHLMYYNCHKISLNCNGSYIDYLDWIKNKTNNNIYLVNYDDKCFQYAATVALNQEEIEKRSEKIGKIKHFINKCNRKGKNYPSRKIIQQLLLVCHLLKMNIYPA